MENCFYNDFRAVSKAEQLKKINSDLGENKNFDALQWKTPEGITVQPIYHKEDSSQAPKSVNKARLWKLAQYIQLKTEQECLNRIEDALNNDVEVLFFAVKRKPAIINGVIKALQAKKAHAYFCFENPPSKTIMDTLNSHPNSTVLFDSLGRTVELGEAFQDDFTKRFPYQTILNPLTFFVDAAIYANAGANIEQQIAFTLAHLTDYLTHYTPTNKKSKVELVVRLAQGSSYFLEIAKIITFRSLVNTLITAYDFPVELKIIAEPQQRNKSCVDYNVNLLRSSTEVMSAVLGEADVVMNLPYDLRFNVPNHFSDRLARNQVLILKHESYFDCLPNATQGSYFIENLVHTYKQSSWAEFLKIEEAGGWLHQIKNNTLQNQVYKAREEEQKRIADGATTLVGVNKYVDQNSLDAVPLKKDVIASDSAILPLNLHYTS